MTKPKLIVITGPTASGKSALAVSLAKRLSTEIISADSRQIYKGIPIVTAVPSVEERDGITHHLMEILPLQQYYSAAKFAADSLNILDNLFQKNPYVIVCGGSMLYIDALVKGIDDLPTVPDEIRSHLLSQWQNLGNDWLLNKLKDIDPVYYEKIDHRNLKRVFHAVEISLTAGLPYTSLLSGKDFSSSLPFDVIKICLSGDRDLLFSRINQRVERMIEQGLVEEARSVLSLRHLNSLNTVGLKEMFAMFDGIFSLPEAIARIQKNTRVYAKKQLTWHKRDNNINFIDFSLPEDRKIEKILSLIR